MAWLERTLQDYPGTVVAVTHDRYFLDNVAGWILELDRGQGIPYEGNYSGWLEQKQTASPRRSKADERRQRTLAARARVDPHVAPGPPGEGQGPPHRVRAAAGRGRVRARQGRQACEIQIPPGPRLGDLVVEADRPHARATATGSSSTTSRSTLPHGGIVGVIGPNGAGKTTLFRMITGPGAARRRHAHASAPPSSSPTSTSPASRSTADKTVYEEITGGRDDLVVGRPGDPRPRLLRPASASRAATSRRRSASSPAASATGSTWPRCCVAGGNVLLLDEPTNDLDVDTLRALEDGLLAFAGCAVVISHDRWFLDRIATHVLAFEGDSEVRWFEGNFSDYEADRRKRLGADADQPHRPKFKPLAR